jgi:hypothetical protein
VRLARQATQARRDLPYALFSSGQTSRGVELPHLACQAPGGVDLTGIVVSIVAKCPELQRLARQELLLQWGHLEADDRTGLHLDRRACLDRAGADHQPPDPSQREDELGDDRARHQLRQERRARELERVHRLGAEADRDDHQLARERRPGGCARRLRRTRERTLHISGASAVDPVALDVRWPMRDRDGVEMAVQDDRQVVDIAVQGLRDDLQVLSDRTIREEIESGRIVPWMP